MMTLPAYSNTYFEPQWNEFCPNQYINLDTEKNYKLAEKKYWQQRKEDFDEKINTCKSLIPEEHSACYNNLRLVESNATATHIQELQYRLQQYNSTANMMNAVNYQMNTMNNLINSNKSHTTNCQTINGIIQCTSF